MDADQLAALGLAEVGPNCLAIISPTPATIAAPLPPAGLPAAIGDEITIIDTTGQRHVITAPPAAIAPDRSTVTFDGVIGSFFHARAFNGQWYVLACRGVQLS